MDRIKDLANEKSNVIDRTILFPSMPTDQVLSRHMLVWLPFPEHMAPATGIGVALDSGLTGSRHPEYSTEGTK